MEVKTCTKCGKEKPATPEYFHRNGKSKLMSHCKECRCKPKKQKEKEWLKRRVEIYESHYGELYEQGLLSMAEIGRMIGKSSASVQALFVRYKITTKFLTIAQQHLDNDGSVVLTTKEPTAQQDLIEYECPIHGVQSNTFAQIKRNNGCEKCINYKYALQLCGERGLMLQSTFIPTYESDIHVYCKLHGDTTTKIRNLQKSKYGCYECGQEFNLSRYQNFGWEPLVAVSRDKRRYLDEYCCVYIIRLFDGSEDFYKIGISKDLKKRVWDFPYNYEVIKLIETDRYNAVFIEKNLHRYHKKYKYTPKKSFGGEQECFDRILLKGD